MNPALTATFAYTYYRPGRYFLRVTVRDALGQVAQSSAEIVIISRNNVEILRENKLLRAAISTSSDGKTIVERYRKK